MPSVGTPLPQNPATPPFLATLPIQDHPTPRLARGRAGAADLTTLRR